MMCFNPRGTKTFKWYQCSKVDTRIRKEEKLKEEKGKCQSAENHLLKLVLGPLWAKTLH